MALLESALEELGLAPLWVTRGSANTAAVLQDAQNAQGDVAVAADAAGAAPAANVSADAARPEAVPDFTAARPEPAVAPAPTDDDVAWFDDLPAPPSARAPTPATDEASEKAADSATATPPVASLDWDALAARVAGCERCRLCEKRTQTVFGVGDRDADWMLIGEAPGENEDRQGEPFVGQAGKLLDNMLRSLSLARGANVYIANVLKCRPPGNRNPEPDEVARCEPYLQRQVALVKPKLIVALGRFAAQSLLKTDASISSMRGRVHAYEGVPVIVTYHPAYLLRSLHDKAKAWQDLCLARDTWRKAAASAGHDTHQLAGPLANSSADQPADPAANPAAD
jgi:uracil-DNA glycosylase family 4